ncbi:diguanylate cyclase domain-containing protein, partial [Spirillospora albida]|uniref:diguanylate cyclase domain-containing protein n=1 Tax=Spirillospora albida TaxID=58123 RepID=UPI00069146EE
MSSREAAITLDEGAERAGASRALVRYAPLLMIAALTVFAGVWFAWTVDGTPAPFVAWIPPVLSTAIAAYTCLRSARWLSGPVRLFWGRLGVAIALVSLGAAIDAADSLIGPGAPESHVSPAAVGVYLFATVLLIWALLMIPIPRRSRGEWLTLGLDAGIFVLGGGLYLWYYLHLKSDGVTAAAGIQGSEFSIIALGLAVALVAIKLAFTGAGPLDRRALWTLGAGVLLSCVIAGLVGALGESRPHLSAAQLGLPGAILLVALGAEIQRQAGAPAPRRRRPYSWLPYAAVGGAHVLMLVSLRSAEGPSVAIVVGVIVLTGLVVLRQIIAFRDIGSLLGRLDASMAEVSRYERRFRALQRYSSDVTTIVGPDQTLTYVSPAAERVFGEKAEALVGRFFLEGFHPDDVPILNEHGAKLFEGPGATAISQVRMRHADGSWRWMELYATNSIGDPAVDGIVSNIRDVNEIRRVQDALAHQAGHDALTDLPNRVLLVERTDAAVASTGGRGVALAMIDMDDFKAINDRLGHAVGDALLVAVAGRLLNCVRPGDTIARLGGDEFAVLLQDIADSEIDAVLDRISAALSGIVNALGHDLLVHASIGLARHGRPRRRTRPPRRRPPARLHPRRTVPGLRSAPGYCAKPAARWST